MKSTLREKQLNMDLLNQKSYSYYINLRVQSEEAIRNLIKETVQTEKFKEYFKETDLNPKQVIYTLHAFILYKKYLKSDSYYFFDSGYDGTEEHISIYTKDFTDAYGEKYFDLIEDKLEEMERNMCPFEIYSQVIKIEFPNGDTVSFDMFEENMEYGDEYTYYSQYGLDTDYEYVLPYLSDIIDDNKEYIIEMLDKALEEYNKENQED